MPKPKEIDFGFIHVDEKTWTLELPTEEMLLSELEPNLDIAYLDQEGTDDWNLTPRQLIAEPTKNPGHFQRVRDADLNYPIHLYFFDGSWKILDGIHRLCKAFFEKRKVIVVRKVPPELISKILK